MQARTLDDFLNADKAMARLAAHAGRLLKLQSLFEEVVPAMLARTCRIANFKSGAIFIHAENGAVAAKLRQIIPSLSDEFRTRGVQVTEIRIKVQPLDVAVQHNPPVQGAVLGDAGRASIARLADSLPEGPLRESLGRFIAHSK
jgi:hypothetical protein